MSRLLLEELLEAGGAVLRDARDVFAASTDERVRQLATRVPSPSDSPWRLVATGEYNAGKSTLLRALTGDPDIRIDADVATDRASEHRWNNILLVDTPGVAAGREVHDELAEVAIRDADLVLFVLTVGLFDETTELHFRHVAIELGKLGQMIVVINKSTQLPAAPGVRVAAVQKSLGEHHRLPPIVECDGLAMLRAELEGEQELRDFEEARSGRSDLVRALDGFVRAQGGAGRIRKPFEAVLAVVADARPYLAPDDVETALQALLARRRESLALSRQRMMNALDEVYAVVTDAITGAGELVIASARDGVPQSEAVSRFDAEAQSAAEGLELRVKEVFARELVNLQADEKGIAAGPEAQVLETFAIQARQRATNFDGGALSDGDSPVARMLQDYLSSRGTTWLKDAVVAGSRPGSPIHGLVTNLGHGLGHKFKPWQAVRWANRLNVAMQAAMLAFEFYRQLDAAKKEEQRDRATLLALRRGIKEAADGLIQQAREEIDPFVELFYSEAGQPVRELEAQVHRLAGDRNRLAADLTQLEQSSRDALRWSDGDGVTAAAR